MDQLKQKITPRYALLPVVALILKLLGYLLLVTAVISGLSTFFGGGRTSPDLTETFLLAVQRILSGMIHGFLLIAASEVIHVLLDIEENTRRAADVASGQVSGTTPRT